MFLHFNEKSQSPDSRLAQFRILRPPVLCSSSFFPLFLPRQYGAVAELIGGWGGGGDGPHRAQKKKGEQNKKRGNKTRGAGQNAPKARGDQRKAGEKKREGNHPRRAKQEKRKGWVCQQHRRKPRKHAGRVAPSRLLFFLPPSPPLAAHTPLSSLQLVPRAFVTSPILILRELGTACPECVERNRLERGKGRECVFVCVWEREKERERGGRNGPRANNGGGRALCAVQCRIKLLSHPLRTFD